MIMGRLKDQCLFLLPLFFFSCFDFAVFLLFALVQKSKQIVKFMKITTNGNHLRLKKYELKLGTTTNSLKIL